MASFLGGYPGYSAGPQHGRGGQHDHGEFYWSANATNGSSYAPYQNQHAHQAYSMHSTPAQHASINTPYAPVRNQAQHPCSTPPVFFGHGASNIFDTRAADYSRTMSAPMRDTPFPSPAALVSNFGSTPTGQPIQAAYSAPSPYSPPIGYPFADGAGAQAHAVAQDGRPAPTRFDQQLHGQPQSPFSSFSPLNASPSQPLQG